MEKKLTRNKRNHVTFIKFQTNGDIVVEAEIGVNKGTLHYALLVTFMDLGPHATADGTLSKVRILMALRIRPDLIVHLDAFDIKSTGFLSIDVKGLGIILNFLIELVGLHFYLAFEIFTFMHHFNKGSFKI
jgi:hypothetical protein